VFCAPILAQKLGAIEGKVVFDDGAVPNAVVIIKREGTKTPVERRLRTDADGKFYVSQLTPGNYLLSFSWEPLNRTVTRNVAVGPTTTMVPDVFLSVTPCTDGRPRPGFEPADSVKAEIVRELIDISLLTKAGKPIFVLGSVRLDWLSERQREGLSIMTRNDVQTLTERSDSQNYFSVSEIKDYGECVGVSLAENITIKGQQEDANMAGGGTVYEFRRINGRWVGKALITWIS